MTVSRFSAIGFGLVACVGMAAGVAAEDTNWPTWRGQDLGGLAAEGADPPVTFSETQNVKWKVPIPGSGLSAPVIWGNRIFLLTSEDTGEVPNDVALPPKPNGRRGGRAPGTVHQFDVLCIDRDTGKTLWRKTAIKAVPHEGHHGDAGFASCSPVTDGRHVWASFGSRGVHCFDMDGNKKWSRDLGRLRTRNAFGEGSSPVLAGDALIVLMDHEGESSIVALNKDTGDILWRKERDERTTWTTPLVVNVDGQSQVIVPATNKTRSYDPANGDVIWSCGGLTANVIASAVTGHGMVYCTSGRRGHALQAITLGRTGDLTDTDAVRWQIDRNTPYVPSPLLYDDKVYVYLSNDPMLSCYNALTGEPLYERQRVEGMRGVYASPVGASGRLYLTGRRGTIAVIKNSDTYQVLATNKLDERFDASPAIAGNELFLRGHKSLYCIAEP